MVDDDDWYEGADVDYYAAPFPDNSRRSSYNSSRGPHSRSRPRPASPLEVIDLLSEDDIKEGVGAGGHGTRRLTPPSLPTRSDSRLPGADEEAGGGGEGEERVDTLLGSGPASDTARK